MCVRCCCSISHKSIVIDGFSSSFSPVSPGTHSTIEREQIRRSRSVFDETIARECESHCAQVRTTHINVINLESCSRGRVRFFFSFILHIPRSTGYSGEAKTIQIHDEDVGQMFHEMDAASISHSLSRAKQPQYSYREQVCVCGMSATVTSILIVCDPHGLLFFAVKKYIAQFAGAAPNH